MTIDELASLLQGRNHSEIARRAGVTRAYVNAIANGARVNPSLAMVNKILAAIAAIDAEVPYI